MTRIGPFVCAVVGVVTLGLVRADLSHPETVVTGGIKGSPTARPAQSAYPLPPPPVPLREMRPFPIVRIVGQTTPTGARIRILSVRAPATAAIAVLCRGRGCPGRSGRSVARGLGIGRTVRFKQFERRLRAGTVLEVFVGAPNVIGKFTRFRIRRGRAPGRRDLCLRPGATQGTACPEG